MGFRDLAQTEIDALLRHERLIRVAFEADGDRFLVPMFFVWHDGCPCGLTTPGRKTALAGRNPMVSFQIDGSATSGHFEWQSLSGEGTWEVIGEPGEVGEVARKLQAKLRDAPEWAVTMLNQRFADLGMVPWRIRVSRLSGRGHGPDES